ncbi:MAG: exo-alpha-sialidase [Akkermansiaceae bacterium]|nr:exo-alpha-sialidase [Akkermansiaceae bacterium]
MERIIGKWSIPAGKCVLLGGALLGMGAAAEGQPSGTEAAGIITRWCFERDGGPLEDTAPSGTVKDVIEEVRGVTFGEGLANFEPDGFLKIKPGKETDLRSSGTIWFRFRLPVDEGKDETGGVRVFFENDSLQLSLVPGGTSKDGPKWGIGAAGKDAGTELEPKARPLIPSGVWVQIALTVEGDGPSERKGKLYHRAELTGKEVNQWVHAGSFTFTEKPASGIYLKNGQASAPLLVDEIKFIDRCLDIAALEGQWPSMNHFESIEAKPPGVVINHSAAKTGRFIAGSPSIVILADGSYIAKGDDYGPAVGKTELVRIHRSTDRGATWRQISEIEGLTWASLFLHRGALYMMGTSAGHGLGHVVIVKSTDGGLTWTKPADQDNGLIFPDLSYHTAPVPVVVHGGRIWRTMEDEKGPGKWGMNFRAFLMSAAEDADLLKASSWTMSDTLGYDPTRLGGNFKGWLEGNTVISPDGTPVNVLRVSLSSGGATAALVHYDAEGRTSRFDAAKDFVKFPGGSTKFHILFDPETKLYWALSNAVPQKHDSTAYGQALIRNTLVLMTSRDLRSWDIRKTVLYHPDISKHGFQYPVFQFDGEDMIFVSRTAYDDGMGGAFRQHDTNYFTFHRIPEFRKLAPSR